MITSVDSALAQQIVNTVKDVCGYDINFISENGEIFASTNTSRIGTFHEIGKKAAFSGFASNCAPLQHRPLPAPHPFG